MPYTLNDYWQSIGAQPDAGPSNGDQNYYSLDDYWRDQQKGTGGQLANWDAVLAGAQPPPTLAEKPPEQQAQLPSAAAYAVPTLPAFGELPANYRDQAQSVAGGIPTLAEHPAGESLTRDPATNTWIDANGVHWTGSADTGWTQVGAPTQPQEAQPEVKPGDVPILGGLAQWVANATGEQRPEDAFLVGGLTKAISDITKPTTTAPLTELPQAEAQTAQQFVQDITTEPDALTRVLKAEGDVLGAVTEAVGGVTGTIRDLPFVGGLYRAVVEAPMNIVGEAITPTAGGMLLAGETLGRGASDVIGELSNGALGFQKGGRLQEYYDTIGQAARDASQKANPNVSDYLGAAYAKAPLWEQITTMLANPVNFVDIYPIGALQRGKAIAEATRDLSQTPALLRILYRLPEAEKTAEGGVKLVEGARLGLRDKNLIERVWPLALSEKGRGFATASRVVDNVRGFVPDQNLDGLASLLRAMKNADETGELSAQLAAKYPTLASRDGMLALRATSGFDVEAALADIAKQRQKVQDLIEAGRRIKPQDLKGLGTTFRDVAMKAAKGPQAPENFTRSLETASKYELLSQWTDHSAENIRTALGIKDIGAFKKIMNGIKAWEATFYIALNPGMWIRNGLNNKSMLLIHGVFPWQNRDTANLIRMMDEIGYNPLGELGVTARRTLAGTAETKANLFGTQLPHTLDGLMKFNRQIEEADRSLAYWSGWKRGWQSVWTRGKGFPLMPADVEATLRAVNPRLPDTIYGAIERGYTKEQIAAALSDFRRAQSAQMFYELPEFQQALGRAIGLDGANADTIRAFLSSHADRINEAIANAIAKEKTGTALDQALDEEFGGIVKELLDHVTTHAADEQGLRDAISAAGLESKLEQGAQLSEAEAKQLEAIYAQAGAGLPADLVLGQRQLNDLRRLGYSADDIHNLTPNQARQIIAERRMKTPAQAEDVRPREEQLAEFFGENQPTEQPVTAQPSPVEAPTAPTPLKVHPPLPPKEMPPPLTPDQLHPPDVTPTETPAIVPPNTPTIATPAPASELPAVEPITYQHPPELIAALTKDGRYTPEQVAQWTPEMAARIAADENMPLVRTVPPDIEELRMFAARRLQPGVGTVTPEGTGYDSHLLNALNNHRPYGMPEFKAGELEADPVKRLDAWNILTNYTPRELRTYPNALTRDQFWTQFRQGARNLSDQEFAATQSVVDAEVEALAKMRGETPEQIYSRFAAVESGSPSAGALKQTTKGATEILDDGRAIMRFMRSHDVSTAIHEPQHQFLMLLPPEERAIVERWAGVKEGSLFEAHGRLQYKEINLNSAEGRQYRKVQEQFARGFEKYLAEGVAPNERLATVFAQFRDWMLSIYRKITGSEIDVQLSDEVRALFGRMLDSEQAISPSDLKAVERELKGSTATGNEYLNTRYFDQFFKPGTAEGKDVWLYKGASHNRLPHTWYPIGNPKAKALEDFPPFARSDGPSVAQRYGTLRKDWQRVPGHEVNEWADKVIARYSQNGLGGILPDNANVDDLMALVSENRHFNEPETALYQRGRTPRLPKAQPGQIDMFTQGEQANADLPIVSGTPIEARPEAPFNPQEVAPQPELPGLEKPKPEFPNQPTQATLDDAAQQFQLFQEAHQPMPAEAGPNAVDAAVDEGARLTEVLKLLKQYLLSEMQKADGAAIDPLAMQGMNKWLAGQVYPSMVESRAAANAVGRWRLQMSLLNYDARYNFDDWLSWAFPFMYWRTASARNWLQTFADRPGMLLSYLRAQALIDAQTIDPRYPSRLNGRLRLAIPFLPEWMGGEVFFDPLETAMPVKSIFTSELQRAQYGTPGLLGMAPRDEDIARVLRNQATAGQISRSDAENAIASKSGNLWEQAKQSAQQDQASWDNLGSLFTPHAPLAWIWAAMTDNSASIGPLLPASRPIKDLTALAGIGGPGGVNVESPLRGLLRSIPGLQNLPQFDPFEEYRIDRMLANMVSDHVIDVQTAKRAMLERTGPAWLEAQKRAAQEDSVPALSGQFGLRSSVLPTGERGTTNARYERDALMRQEVQRLGGAPQNMTWGEQSDFLKAHGAFASGMPLSQFYDQHPEISARSATFQEPETLLKSWLQDEVWSKYNSLGELDQRLVRADPQFGDTFGKLFLSKDTRDYAQIPLLTLIRWTQGLDGYVPQTPTGEIAAVDESRLNPYQLSLATPTQSQAYQKYYDLVDQSLGGWSHVYDLQDQYYAIAETDKAGRSNFVRQHPELQAYWELKKAFFNANPDIQQMLVDRGLMNAPSAQAAYSPFYKSSKPYVFKPDSGHVEVRPGFHKARPHVRLQRFDKGNLYALLAAARVGYQRKHGQQQPLHPGQEGYVGRRVMPRVG